MLVTRVVSKVEEGRGVNVIGILVIIAVVIAVSYCLLYVKRTSKPNIKKRKGRTKR